MQDPTIGGSADASPVSARRDVTLPRWLAVMQIVAICGIPTQAIVAIGLFFGTELGAQPGRTPIDRIGSLEFTAPLMFVDTALIALLIRVFLELSNEDSKTVFVGRRPVMGEILKGLLLVPVVAIVMTLLINAIRALFPALQTVDKNPLAEFMGTPLEASVFVVVVIIGAGIKEELQRAFILHRFEQRLGGIRVGLVFFSLLFAVLHFPQGLDAALAIGLLGVFWGVLYIRRQSAIMSISNHAGFDALQVALGHLLGTK